MLFIHLITNCHSSRTVILLFIKQFFECLLLFTVEGSWKLPKRLNSKFPWLVWIKNGLLKIIKEDDGVEALKTVRHYINSACKISRTQQYIAFSQRCRWYQLLLRSVIVKPLVPTTHGRYIAQRASSQFLSAMLQQVEEPEDWSLLPEDWSLLPEATVGACTGYPEACSHWVSQSWHPDQGFQPNIGVAQEEVRCTAVQEDFHSMPRQPLSCELVLKAAWGPPPVSLVQRCELCPSPSPYNNSSHYVQCRSCYWSGQYQWECDCQGLHEHHWGHPLS